MKLPTLFALLNALLDKTAGLGQPVFLLLIRLYWGWSFFQTGKGKLMALDRTTEFFASLNIPAPKLNAILAGSTECFGGLLLALGLLSRVASVPLMFTMLVAYATADREALFSVFSDTDKFTGATPFLFLLTVVIVFLFGPGRWSLDALLRRKANAGMPVMSATTAEV